MFAVHSEALTPAALHALQLQLVSLNPEEGRAELDEYGELILARLDERVRCYAEDGKRANSAFGIQLALPLA